MTRRTAALAALCGIVIGLTGCSSGPSVEDETACKLFAEANNRVTTAAIDWVADGEPESGSDAYIHAQSIRAGTVQEAADRATGDLAVTLSEAARLALGAPGSETGSFEYFLHRQTVYESCEALGVKLTILETPERLGS